MVCQVKGQRSRMDGWMDGSMEEWECRMELWIADVGVGVSDGDWTVDCRCSTE